MEIFVNRELELSLIFEAVETLIEKRRLLKTPIIEFYGIQGVGKTTLLRNIEHTCRSRQLPYFWVDFKQNATLLYMQPTKELLNKRQPVVMILDSLDAANAEQLREIEAGLGELINNSLLFVVLSCKSILRFDTTRSIARKLTVRQLMPLKRESCLSYLNAVASSTTPEIHDIIFDWTRGYPLAMKIMADGILKEQLDPTKEQDQKRLVKIIKEEVIEKNLLVNVTSTEEQTRLQTLLALLSIPRRFNLTLSQDLIEEFAPQYKLESSLAYITLPPDINRVTSVLYWSVERAGYCIEAPVRNLFLLQYRIEQPHQYAEIHKFLAEKNESFSHQVAGSDRIRYLREFFYHLAYSKEKAKLSEAEEAKVQESLAQQIEQLAQVQTQEELNPLQSLENFFQFYEEFQQDQELKEALGQQNASFALSLMYRKFLDIYRQLPAKIQGDWLIKFFSLVTQQPANNDFALLFEEGMRQIIKQVASDDAVKLYYELIQDEELKVLLGAKFDESKAHILAELLDEG